MSRFGFGKLRTLFGKSAASGPQASSTLPGTTASLRSAWQLMKPYYTASDEKWKARVLLATVVGLTLGQVYIDVRLSKWGNTFYNTLSALDRGEDKAERHKQAANVHDQLKHFSILAALFIGALGAKYKLSQKLQLDWRRWMTREYSNAWMSGDTHYRIQSKGLTDNPDQRITDDVMQFTSSSLGLSLGLLRASTSLPSFSYILYNMSPGLMVGALGYAAVGTYLGHLRGRPLVKQYQDQQKLEADMRFAYVYHRNNAEAIAMSHGEDESVERAILDEKVEKVVENKRRIIETEKAMTIYNAIYNQAAIIAPYIITLPRLRDKELNLGDFMQGAGAFRQVQGDLSWFFDSYAELSNWRAVTNRLTTFNGAMASVKAVPGATVAKPQPAGV